MGQGEARNVAIHLLYPWANGDGGPPDNAAILSWTLLALVEGLSLSHSIISQRRRFIEKQNTSPYVSFFFGFPLLFSSKKKKISSNASLTNSADGCTNGF